MAPYAAIFAIGNDKRPVPDLPEKFSQDAIEFVRACLTRDQNLRPTAAELVAHPFIANRKRKSISISESHA